MRFSISVVSAFAMAAAMIVAPSNASAGPLDSPVEGSIFIDFDRDGAIDPGDAVESTDPLFPPGGVTVTATDPAGNTSNGVVTSTPAGITYSLPTTALQGQDYRIDFSFTAADIAAGYTETFAGKDHVAGTMFVAAGDTVDFGVLPPSQCPTTGAGFAGNANQGDGKLWTTCFVNGNREAGGPQDVLVGFNYNGSGAVEKIGLKGDQDASTSASSELGSVWGVAYDEWSSTLYTSAFLKRQAGLGAEGVDGLYYVQYPSGTWSSVSLDSLGGPSFGADPTARGLGNSTQRTRDAGVFPLVSRRGIGDIDTSPDGKRLFVTNIDDAARALMVYDTSSPSGAPTSLVASVPIVNPGCPDTANPDDFQIHAVTTLDSDTALVGLVCTGENSALATQAVPNAHLRAHVIRVDISDPAAPTQTSVLDMPMSYERGCGNTPRCANGSFSPWSDAYAPLRDHRGAVARQQGVLSDIEVLTDGSLVLGFFDRFSHQQGWDNYIPTSNSRKNVYAAGETLHVCNVSGDPDTPSYVVEGQSPACGTNFANPAGANRFSDDYHGGPYVDGEFYGGDARNDHTETSLGGLYAHPYRTEIVTAAMDPARLFSGGVNYFSTTTGATTQSKELYRSRRISDGLFGKGAGIGDVEGCALIVGIGNLVWFDRDGDGVQDAGEPPLVNATITVTGPGLPGGGVSIVTDADGRWNLTSADGLRAGNAYTVTVDPSTVSALPSGVALADLVPTVQDSATDGIDSDLAANSTIAVAALNPGEVNHTYDAGFTAPLTYRVGSLVWSETDGDGIAESGETPLGGITVELLDAAGGVVDTTITGANGEYEFDGLDAGTYSVRLPGGQAGLTGLVIAGSSVADADNDVDNDNNAVFDGSDYVSGPFELGDGSGLAEPTGESNGLDGSADDIDGFPDAASNQTIDFGFVLPNRYRVGNLVWLDTDNDGLVSSGESPLPGVVVQLTDAAGVAIQSTVTSATGNYVFTDLPAGDYRIQIPVDQSAGTAGVLAGLAPSTGPGVDADPDDAAAGEDNDSNGAESTTDSITRSGVFTLGDPGGDLLDASEPTDETIVVAGGSGDDDIGDGATIDDDESDFTVDFGFYEPLRIGSTVWRDDGNGDDSLDDDGQQNNGEAGIGGILVQLLDDAGAVIAETVTDSNGDYVFDGLNPGDYRVVIPVDQVREFPATAAPTPGALDGLRSSTSRTGTDTNSVDNEAANADDDGISATIGGEDYIASDVIELTRGAEPAGESNGDEARITALAGAPRADSNSQLQIDFGLSPQPTYRVGNLVFADHDDDGVAEPGEPGLAGVLVQLLDDVGDVVEEQVTDANGKYAFDGLAAGEYQVRIPAAQTAVTLGLQTLIDPDALADSRSSGSGVNGPTGVDTDSDVDNDNDGNGDLSVGADLVSGVFELGEGNDHAEPTGEVLRNGDATDDDPGTQAGGTRDDRSNYSVDFGIFRRVRIGNQVWLDDGPGLGNQDNGRFDTDEVGIAGVQVELWLDDGVAGFDPTLDTLVETVTTDGEGNYVFGGLEPGLQVYVAIETVPGPAVQSSTGQSATAFTADNDDDGSPVGSYQSVSELITVPTAGGAAVGEQDTVPGADDSEADADARTGVYPDSNSDLQVDFGFVAVPLYRIGNLVWLDANNNGTADTGEAGIEGILVQLLDANGVVLSETATSATGEYSFENLVTGDYSVRIPTSQVPELGPLPGVFPGALAGLISSSPDATTPNDDADNDDNGVVGADAVQSGTISVGETPSTPGTNTEPSNETVRTDDLTDDDSGNSAFIADIRSNYTVDFGFYALALGDTVWLDLDNSGTIDAGEPEVRDVTVELYLDDGDGVFDAGDDTLAGTDVTDASGRYYFDGLAAATYFVHIPASQFAAGGALEGTRSSTGNGVNAPDPDADVTDGDDNGDPVDGDEPVGGVVSPAVTLEVGGEPDGDLNDDPNFSGIADDSENTTVDFGFYALEVGNRVFLDANNNELLDGNESGIGSVTVELLDVNGDVIATTQTAADGTYLFAGLREGTYSVRLPASNFEPGGPLAGLFSSDGPDGIDTPADVDADTSDLDDNGAPADPTTKFTGGAVVSEPFDLAAAAEPDDETEESPNASTADASSNLSVDFGLTSVPTLELGNQLWFDLDNSGTFDPTETVVPDGVVVNLWLDPDGDGIPDTNVATFTTTGGTGTYLFDGLTPGTYIVQLDPANFAAGAPLAGFGPSTGAGSSIDPEDGVDSNNDGFRSPDAPGIITGPVTLDYGTEPIDEDDAASSGTRENFSNLSVDIGLIPGLELGNQIFIDTNNDGSGVGDGGAPVGVVVNLLDEDGVVIDSTITDADGRYLFTGLPVGTFAVELPASNFAVGGPLAGFHVSTGPASSSDPNDDVDQNNDGIAQSDGSVRTGLVTLVAAGEPVDEVDAASTTANSFSNLTLDIGVYQLALGDTVWFDTDNNGRLDAGEAVAPAGVTVVLTDLAGDAIAQTTTDASGNYEFTGLAEGDYVVVIPASEFAAGALLDGQISSTGNDVNGAAPDPDDDVDGDDNGNPTAGGISSAPISLSGGDEPGDGGSANDSVDFGLIPAGSIGSVVFVDVDRDGQRDPGEVGIANVEVRLLDGAGAVVAVQTTGPDGEFLFDGLPPGDYQVEVIRPPNTTFTVQNSGDDASDSDVDPGSGRTGIISLGLGEDRLDLFAGVITGDLPATGGDGFGLRLVVAATLLLIGLALVAATRRRRCVVRIS